jgi:biopolymer transport protein ExbB
MSGESHAMSRSSQLGVSAALALCFWLAIVLPAHARQGPSEGVKVRADETGGSGDASAANGGGSGESFLRWMARASGPIGVVILGMSFYLIALVAWMFFTCRVSVAIPPDIVREVGELLERKKYTEAFHRLSNDRSFLSRVLSAGVRKVPSGLPAAQRAMEMANDDVTMELEHHTTYLATVGTLGPMIGLVGTVYGMILSFRVIATAGSNPQASQLAAGISTALFATLEGIALSVPAIAFYAFFRNRIARLSLEVEMMAETLLEGFAPGARLPHPLVTQAAAGPQRAALPPKADG